MSLGVASLSKWLSGPYIASSGGLRGGTHVESPHREVPEQERLVLYVPPALQQRRRDCTNTCSMPAAAFEEAVWKADYNLLSDPARLRRQHERHVGACAAGGAGTRTRSRESWPRSYRGWSSGGWDVSRPGGRRRHEPRAVAHAKLADLKEQRGG